MGIKRLALTVTMVVGALLASGGASQALAAAPDTTTSTTTAAASSSPELQAYLKTLSPADRAQFVKTKVPSTITTTVTTTKVSGGATTSAAAAAGGCWTQRATGSAKAALGNTLYTFYVVGRWCSNGSRVTSSSIADSGGETSTPGWRYEGIINRGSGIVSGQSRAYVQAKFVLGAGGWDIQSPTPCVRQKGNASGSGSSDSTCGIY